MNKENMRIDNYQTARQQSGSRYRTNMLMISKEGNESFLKISQKLKDFQIMEFSLVIDECLKFVGDMGFIKEKLKSRQTSLVRSEIRIVSSKREKVENNASLGLQSMKEKMNKKIEDIDLSCD